MDFYCHQARLVVELDGSQHWEPEEIAYDTIRTAYLEKQGLRVVRYSNRQIDREFSGICENIHHIVWENMAIIDGKPPSFGGGVCDKGADEGGNNKE